MLHEQIKNFDLIFRHVFLCVAYRFFSFYYLLDLDILALDLDHGQTSKEAPIVVWQSSQVKYNYVSFEFASEAFQKYRSLPLNDWIESLSVRTNP